MRQAADATEEASSSAPDEQHNRGRGQPTRYRPETVARILCDIRSSTPKTKAVAGNGIVIATLYNWEAAHPEFAEAIRLAQDDYRRSRQLSAAVGVIARNASASGKNALSKGLRDQRHVTLHVVLTIDDQRAYHEQQAATLAEALNRKD